MLASAIVAYVMGPAIGFAFALVVGSICGWAFAMSVVGRGPELEKRALVTFGPLADHILARAVRPIVAQVRARIARRRGLLVETPEDEVIDLDLDLEVRTDP